jgi:hypothetical protein
MPAVIGDKDPSPRVTGRDVCQVLREVTLERRVLVKAGDGSWGQLDAPPFVIDVEGWRITLCCDAGSLNHCEEATSPDGLRWSFDPGDRYGTDPFALLSTWEHQTRRGLELRALGKLLMHADVLETILDYSPEVRIVLSTSWVRLLSFKRARGVLPEPLQARVIGATWHTKMLEPPYGYDLQTRYEQIRAAATRAGMTRWLALDDDPDHSWPDKRRTPDPL